MDDRVELYKGDCVEVMRGFDKCSIDLVVTSPPYDDLRSYKNTCEWNFNVFKSVANELVYALYFAIKELKKEE